MLIPVRRPLLLLLLLLLLQLLLLLLLLLPRSVQKGLWYGQSVLLTLLGRFPKKPDVEKRHQASRMATGLMARDSKS